MSKFVYVKFVYKKIENISKEKLLKKADKPKDIDADGNADNKDLKEKRGEIISNENFKYQNCMTDNWRISVFNTNL